MEAVTCSECKAYAVSYDGSRHRCRLGFPVKCLGMNKYIQTHLYGPARKCPRPLTDEKLIELTGQSRTEELLDSE